MDSDRPSLRLISAPGCGRCRKLLRVAGNSRESECRLHWETAGEIFVTAILGRLDPKARSLTCLNAGHPAAIVLNSAGEIKAHLGGGSLPFAIMPEARFVADESVELADGDLVFIYTDGLVEVHRRGEPLFGIERALQVAGRTGNGRQRRSSTPLHRAACQYAGAEKPTGRYHRGRRQGPGAGRGESGRRGGRQPVAQAPPVSVQGLASPEDAHGLPVRHHEVRRRAAGGIAWALKMPTACPSSHHVRRYPDGCNRPIPRLAGCQEPEAEVRYRTRPTYRTRALFRPRALVGKGLSPG